MTDVIKSGSISIINISPGKKQACQLCGKVAVTRPYGPDGEEICFECGMKDEEGTRRRCAEHFGLGKGATIVLGGDINN